ncbi:hypothetical protein QN277_017860 [Acacia crassicarpa]|uniref:B30.2/SPRY domain-containing protein n=1 Tax=Acacia crassicarpa TaxID=499986 RepID=A0AAE1JQA1_9FABA|nr:hypothetical protein QN277_017860 [Acacia crassicarpa]
MREWAHVVVIAGSLGCVSTLLLVCIWRWCHHKQSKTFVEPVSLQSGITKLHQKNDLEFGGGVSAKPLFKWSDHPLLAADAVENGWSRFAFLGHKTSELSPSKRTVLFGLGVCGSASGDQGGEETEAEISWEMCQESVDFMQKIRLNPGLKRIHPNNSSVSFLSVIQSALPLPGPPLGNYSFPQEAYFEITVLYASGSDDYEWNGKNNEGERIKLIQDNSNSKGNHIEEMRAKDKEEGKCESAILSVGLTSGVSVPLKTPGSYAGSISFNSNGSVFLEGMKLVKESEKEEWVGSNKVIGCGYDPRLKKVFFTVGSELVHVIQCYSEEFGAPMYPTLAANLDITVLVNFGQSAFKYGPANVQRTPNPCFITPLVNTPTATLGYDDSKELFSMGRIDSQWRHVVNPKGSYNNNNNGVIDFDDESEADLFEIVLDRS